MGDFITKINEKGYSYIFFLIYISLVIFAPYIKVGNRDNFEITFVVTLIFVILVPFTLKRIKYSENKTLNIMFIILLLILALDTMSILNFIRVNRGVNNLLANIIPNLKVGLYMLLLVGFYNFKPNSRVYSLFLFKVMPVLAGTAAVIGIFQHFNFLNFNNWFTKYYISSESGRILIEVLKEKEEWSRVLGTLSNPNFFGLEIIIFLIFIVSNVIYSRNKRIKAINLIISVLLFITIIFSQSRTALITLILVSVYIMLIQTFKGGVRNIFKYLLITLGITLVSLLLIKFLSLNYLFDVIKNGLDTRSITQRIARWKDAIELFKLHPIVGIGPVIGTYFPAVDNEYVHIIRNYGILGLLGHLSFYIFIFVITFKDIFLRSNDSDVHQYAFAVNCSVLAVLIANITLATFYHWRNFVLLLFVCSMWAKMRNIKEFNSKLKDI